MIKLYITVVLEGNMDLTRLKKLRKEHNLTQNELSEKTGIKHYSISDYEVGRVEPDLQTLIILAKFFNVSLDYILGFQVVQSDEKNTNKGSDILFTDIKYKKLLYYISLLPETDIALITQLVENLLNKQNIDYIEKYNRHLGNK